MDIIVRRVRTVGKEASVIRLTVGGEGEEKSYEIDEGTYRAIGCPLSGDYIDCGTLSEVSARDEERRAMKAALRVLAASDKSILMLKRKLNSGGFSRQATDTALKLCIELGYINEERSLRGFISNYANRELLGPYKILTRLRAKGYSSAAISQAMSALAAAGEIDFKKNLKRLLKKHGISEGSPDSQEKIKLIYKFGYRR